MNLDELMKQAQIAAPCTVAWDDMQGDDKSRFCGQCKLNVFKASAMTDEEVLQALSRAAAGEEVCMRIYRRADGTFLTKDCPVGLARLRQQVRDKVRHAAAWLAGALSLVLSAAAGAAPDAKTNTDAKQKAKWHATIKGNCPPATTTTGAGASAAGPITKVQSHEVMGRMVAPPTAEGVEAQQQQLALAQKADPDSLSVANQETLLAALHERRNNWGRALTLRLAAVKIYEEKGSLKQASDSWLLIAQTHARLGEADKALAARAQAERLALLDKNKK